jgi:hypothetical protein
MASTAYPIAQSGSFNFGNTINIIIETAAAIYETPISDTTGSANGSADAQKKGVRGLTTANIIAEGHLELESNGTEAVAQSGDFTSSGDAAAIHVHQWVLQKTWPLFDVTGSSAGSKDAIKQWRHGLPVVKGSVVGVGKSDLGAQLDFAAELSESTLTFDINQFGILAGNVIIKEKRISAPFKIGGPIGAALSFQFNGVASTWTPTGTQYTWLYPSGAANALGGDPSRGTLTLDIDTSTNIVESAICYHVEIRNPSAIGGKVPVRAAFRLD